MPDMERHAPKGAEWLCPACGRRKAGDRFNMGDTSCVMWAVLVKEGTNDVWKSSEDQVRD